MRSSFPLKCCYLSILLCFPMLGHSLVIDAVSIDSSQGERFYAEIPFSNAQSQIPIQVSVEQHGDLGAVASANSLHAAPSYFNTYVRQNAQGDGVIIITSTRPIQEKNIQLLLKVTDGNQIRLQKISSALPSRADRLQATLSGQPLQPTYLLSEQDINHTTASSATAKPSPQTQQAKTMEPVKQSAQISTAVSAPIKANVPAITDKVPTATPVLATTNAKVGFQATPSSSSEAKPTQDPALYPTEQLAAHSAAKTEPTVPAKTSKNKAAKNKALSSAEPLTAVEVAQPDLSKPSITSTSKPAQDSALNPTEQLSAHSAVKTDQTKPLSSSEAQAPTSRDKKSTSSYAANQTDTQKITVIALDLSAIQTSQNAATQVTPVESPQAAITVYRIEPMTYQTHHASNQAQANGITAVRAINAEQAELEPKQKLMQEPITKPAATTNQVLVEHETAATHTSYSYEVQANDSLWSISAKISRSHNVPLHLVMQQIKQNNPKAFVNNDVSSLRQGTVLIIPSLNKQG